LEAQALVSKLPGIQKSILALLYSAKQDKRLLAAEWLGRIQATDTIAHLVQQFRKEKSDVVRGTLLKVLETWGADITPYISPSILLKEATTGLAKKMPAALSWFPFDALPSAHWKADGSPVAPEILHWWVVFAFKLKAPGGNPLLKRYLDLLAPKD